MLQVNQDCLENTFSVIRSMGGAKTHPNPLEFATRFRIVKVTNNIASLVSHKANVRPTDDDNIDEPYYASELGNQDFVSYIYICQIFFFQLQ